jgi:hypothetical protein
MSPNASLQTMAAARLAGSAAARAFDAKEPEVGVEAWIDAHHRDRKGRLR